jgi:uncharacterized protein
MLTRLISITLLAVLPNLAQAVTFDCKKASKPDEQLICSNSELSKLDDQVNQTYLYAQAQQPQGQRDYLKLRQREWLNMRHSCKADISCVRQSMKDNMAWLANPHLGYEGLYVNAKRTYQVIVSTYGDGSVRIGVGGEKDGVMITPDSAASATPPKINDNRYAGIPDYNENCVVAVKFDGALAEVTVTPPKGKKLNACLSTKEYIGSFKRDYTKVP